MLEQALRCLADHIEYPVETSLAEIGIWYFHMTILLRVIEHQIEPRPGFIGLDRCHLSEIRLIHCDQKIEFEKILRLELSRTQARQVYPSRSGSILRPGVGWAAYVIAMRTGRVNQDSITQSLLVDQCLKHAMRGRRSADIAHAHKKDFYLVFVTQLTFQFRVKPDAEQYQTVCQFDTGSRSIDLELNYFVSMKMCLLIYC